MLNSRQIEAFRAVVLSGSATAAADLLGVTQPAVSRLIRDLEVELRLALFERGSGRLSPTGDALALYREVERSFVGLDRIRQAARGLRERRAGALRVAALPALANGFLPGFAARFLANRPELDMTLNGMNSPFVLDWVVGGQCDIGIVGERLRHAAVATEDLEPVEAVAVLPVGHRLATRRALEPADFDGEHFVALSTPALTQYKVDALMSAHDVTLRIRAVTPLSMIACGMVAAGFGSAIVDPFTAERYRGPTLVVKRLRPTISLEWSIISSLFTSQSSIMREFIEVFKDRFKAHAEAAAAGREPDPSV